MEPIINLDDLSNDEHEMLSYCEKLGGQTKPKELVTLSRIANSLPDEARILEIGSYRGRSAAAIGFAIRNTKKKLYCLDLWRNYNTQKDNPIEADPLKNQLDSTDFGVLNDFLKNTELFGENICHLRGNTSDFRDVLVSDSFNMVFIDGAHDYENVCFDIDTAMKILCSDGIICGHDYHSSGHDVIKSVNEKILENPDIKSSGIVPDTSIWIAMLK